MTPNLNHKYIEVKEGDRTDITILQMTTRQGIYHLVETETHHTEVDENLVAIMDKIIEGDHETIIRMTIEETMIENKDTEIGVAVETIAGVPIEIEKILGMTICKAGTLVQAGVGKYNHAPNQEGKTEGIEIGWCQD